MEKAITGPVKAERFTGALRSLDVQNPQMECIDEMINQMAAAERGGEIAILSRDGSPINKSNIVEELSDKCALVRLESTRPRERRSLIECMLKLLGESGG